MTSNRMRALALLSAVVLVLAAPKVWAGPIVDISNDPTYSWTWAQDLTLGYRFSVTNSVTFNALGIFDVVSATPGAAGHTNAAGLMQAHQVAIWDSSGSVVASVTVLPTDPITASSNTYGVWVYRLLASPFTLTTGTYTIGAFYAAGSDPVMVQQSTISPSGVTYLGGSYIYSSTFQRPTGAYPPNEQQYFGPTLMAVPDGGSTLTLLGFALIGLGAVRRRFRG